MVKIMIKYIPENTIPIYTMSYQDWYLIFFPIFSRVPKTSVFGFTVEFTNKKALVAERRNFWDPGLLGRKGSLGQAAGSLAKGLCDEVPPLYVLLGVTLQDPK